jgi:hypothetical protein
LPISQFFNNPFINPKYPNSSMPKASFQSYLLHPASKCQRNLRKKLTGRKTSRKMGISRSIKILHRIQIHLLAQVSKNLYSAKCSAYSRRRNESVYDLVNVSHFK